MAKKSQYGIATKIEGVKKKTSMGNNPTRISYSTMNKQKRRNFKINRGQGR
jgi:hypothetical protein